MAYYSENLVNRIFELLNNNINVHDRCVELADIFDRCNLRQLQDVFPALVQSIFGIGSNGVGWALRTLTKENTPLFFETIYNFFTPQGSMFRLIHRLLNDTIKFEFSLELLPNKVVQLLQSGQYPLFYADLVNIDPFRRQVTSLALNAFDYFILHFVIHGTYPLHKINPIAMQVHNERLKTAYFYLAADYLCGFLPGSTDNFVYPFDFCPTVKAPQSMTQPMQPKRSPKYLKVPNLDLYAGNTSGSSVQAVHNESPRMHFWRTESVLHFFIDIWLRYDVEELRDLPSLEFIRVVRVLVKHMHSFANSAHMDLTSMVTLRKMAQPLMRARIYPFLRGIIGRWPLDSTLAVVLELWLSYIQPWRYTAERSNLSGAIEMPINSRYENFIVDNLVIYTQIFLLVIPRFERLDFTCFRNAVMLHRLVKVFSQTGLCNVLYQAEQAYLGNTYGYESLHRHPAYLRQTTFDGSYEWDNCYPSDMYTPIFSPVLHDEIEHFINTICTSTFYVQREAQTLRKQLEIRRKSCGFFKKCSDFLAKNLLTYSVPPEELKVQEMNKIPALLENAIHSLCNIFNVELPVIAVEPNEQCEDNFSQLNFSSLDESDYLDISKVTPQQMHNKLTKLGTTIDPAMLPIETHEFAVLVRLLHQLSCKLNEKYGEQIQMYWNRTDFIGKIMRLILTPPMTTQWFCKSRGVNELFEKELPPRICLRPLASIRFILPLGLTIIVGHFLCSSPSYGLLLLFVLCLLYLLALIIFK